MPETFHSVDSFKHAFNSKGHEIFFVPDEETMLEQYIRRLGITRRI